MQTIKHLSSHCFNVKEIELHIFFISLTPKPFYFFIYKKWRKILISRHLHKQYKIANILFYASFFATPKGAIVLLSGCCGSPITPNSCSYRIIFSCKLNNKRFAF